MMILGKPQRKDVELVIAGEHRVERGQIAKRLFHHLGPRVYKHPMDGRNDVP